jgi:hypothetical protein
MNLEEAVKESIEAMKKAIVEGKFTEQEGKEFIENISKLK